MKYNITKEQLTTLIEEAFRSGANHGQAFCEQLGHGMLDKFVKIHLNETMDKIEFINDLSSSEWLLSLRKKNNLTQVEFANKIGVTQATITDIERGRVKISTKVAQKISDCFGIAIEDINRN